MLDILKYLSEDSVSQITEAFLDSRRLRDEIPLDIDLLVEQCGFHIVPRPGISRELDVRAFTTSDWKEIWIDHSIYFDQEGVARFTLAHELGHLVLHKEIIEGINDEYPVGDLDSAYDRVLALNDLPAFSRLEKQSDLFAGMLLVSRRHLLPAFNDALERVKPLILEAKEEGVSKNDYMGSVVDKLATFIAPKFSVDHIVVNRRIFEDGLHKHIP